MEELIKHVIDTAIMVNFKLGNAKYIRVLRGVSD